MSASDAVREYYRIGLFVLFIAIALYALFVPGGMLADDPAVLENETVEDSAVNLQYGLGLEGGTRISAPVVGLTAEGLTIDPDDETAVTDTLYEELDLDTGDAMVRTGDNPEDATAEVFTDNVSEEEFADAL